MNALQKCIEDIKFNIPRPILEEAFLRATQRYSHQVGITPSLDYSIREIILNRRILPDLNLVGGQEITIPLKGIVPQFLSPNEILYTIPLSLTQGRKIIRAYSFLMDCHPHSASLHNTVYQGINEYNAYTQAATGMLSTLLPIPQVSNAELELVGDNTILARQCQMPTPDMYLRAVIENDAELNNLPRSVIPILSEMALWATKAYIYNTLIINMDRLYIEGGHALGQFLSIVESYDDANERYREFFQQRWRKAAVLADPEARRRHLKMVSGGLH